MTAVTASEHLSGQVVSAVGDGPTRRAVVHTSCWPISVIN